MNFKFAGLASMKDTKTKIWWTKIALALVISNVFFFLLFGGDNTSSAETPRIRAGEVEVQLEARLHTPFQKGKKVLLVSRGAGKKLVGVLDLQGTELDPRVSVLVPETEAALLFHFGDWEVLPLIENFQLRTARQREDHEIRY